MSQFDTHVVVDWSGGNDAGPNPRKDAIWAAKLRHGVAEPARYFRNRALVETWLGDLIEDTLGRDERIAIGFDFPFGYPRGFAQAVTGSPDPLALWDWFEARVEDQPQRNNRCEIASNINAQFAEVGPFWGNPFRNQDFAHLPRKGLLRSNRDFAERRAVETLAKGSFTCWQLAGAGAVGSQVIMGLPVLSRLRRRFGQALAVWPFEATDRPVALIEVWPSLLGSELARQQRSEEIKDAAQTRVLAAALAHLDRQGRLHAMLREVPETEAEGWILGVGFEEELVAAAKNSAQADAPLANDCFALPAGVDWTPVDTALTSLADRLRPVTQFETIPVGSACGRVVGDEVSALRANPPGANAAVDGYGFAAAHMVPSMPLVEGRAAAGHAYSGKVPAGHAIRILTGAILPEGVDTVIMQEECTHKGSRVQIGAKVTPFQNTRKAGEDVTAGATLFQAGHLLGPQDLALLTATGHAQISVRKRLRVGVLSTGDELHSPSADAPPDHTFDANRPMLLSLVERWGYSPVDLGSSPDSADRLKAHLDDAASRCDVILTSGGASSGEEDHISQLLTTMGHLTHWRIAIKPGRPLALAMWNDVPVFGLPGNPVAAFTCALIFARPSLNKLAGGSFSTPKGVALPATFSKSKKGGRREFLRARLTEAGQVEVFASEGSGRISGLSWADGFVELGDEACTIAPGDLVRYIPFASFGL